MASADSPGSEKTYRFISDPGHKENLSGRVRAACITCRRKKIKCSGEVPCHTCEERGVVCEGLMERKRPRKASEHHEALSVSTQSSPAPSLRKISTMSSDDSGYASGARSRNPSAGSRTHRINTNYSLTSSRVLHSPSNSTWTPGISPTDTDIPKSRFVTRQNSTDLYETETTIGSDLSPTGEVTSSATLSTGPLDWFDTRDQSTQWSHTQPGSPAITNLITAAEALEEQAKSLRRLAFQHEGDEDLTRQSVTCSPGPTANGMLQYSPRVSITTEPPLFLPLDQSFNESPTHLTPEVPTSWDTNLEMPHTVGFEQYPAYYQTQNQFPAMAAVDNTDSTWCCDTGASAILGISVPSEECNGSSILNESCAEMGRPTRGRSFQTQSLYKQLYPWPE